MTTRRSKAWIAFVVINALIVFFGMSYVFFPGADVVKAGHRTAGALAVPAKVWGVYCILSALAMVVIALAGLRTNRWWARRAALYQFAFLASVVLIEPDPVFPPLFGVMLGIALWRSRQSTADTEGQPVVTARG